ncbi:MAG: excinuclease ABC subunit UvrA [Thermoguttaceae bacterium]
MDDISVKGAREHNLCDVGLTLPRGRLICFTGVSGSGKSSLAFDTLYAEGQRRYIESLSTYARQFLGQLTKPDVDHITGLSPSISISQKVGGQSPRSTVGTITEIYDFLRLLFARVATGFCPQCGKQIAAQSRQQMVDRLETLPENTAFLVLAPLAVQQKGEHRDLFATLLKQGYIRARVDGKLVRLDDNLQLDRQMRHTVEVVIDRLVQTGESGRTRLAEAVERAVTLGNGVVVIAPDPDGALPLEEEFRLSSLFACVDCGINFEPPSPQMFSFNSPQGMCTHCEGLGEAHTFDPELLIPNQELSFEQGCIEPLGPWKSLGRWQRHIYRGVAEAIEASETLPPNTVLQTPWRDLPAPIKHALLWGTGRRRITYHLKTDAQGHRWSGVFEGIIPRLTQTFDEARRKSDRNSLARFMRNVACGHCHGSRLNEQARAFRIRTASNAFTERWHSLAEISKLTVADLQEFFKALELSETGQKIAVEVLKEVSARLGFLADVGLGYLSLHRTAPTLSGGEMQRIRLASQIGSGLVGVLYILDEPSIGLHQRDNDRLLHTLKKLRDLGNTVIVVEHDEDTMRAADWIVDFGPGPGIHGGHVVTQGEPQKLIAEQAARTAIPTAIPTATPTPAVVTKKKTAKKSAKTTTNATTNATTNETPPVPNAQLSSLTLQFLAGQERIEVPQTRRPGNGKKLVIRGATHNNLKGIDVAVPLGCFVCVTGVSGSGKSSLVSDIIVEALNRDLNRGDGCPGRHRVIDGIEHLDKMISIDQSPIGRTPRSNPATYIKVFDSIRKLFADLPEAKKRGYATGRFSFNVDGGRCETCEGSGTEKLEMDFLADVWVTCSKCQGRRFNHETLSVSFKGKAIDQVLNMGVEEAIKHFENQPRILHYLETLSAVGLGYMRLGQPSPTLSGGEAQRIKLARELVKRSTGKTLYLLDEPTTGLHFADVRMLLKVLHSFVEAGNTVLVVEHNLDVIKTADWVLDLGPEGGEAGGRIVAEGTPEDIVSVEGSHTGRVLERVIAPLSVTAPARKKKDSAAILNPPPVTPPPKPRETISIRCAQEHNLQNVSLEIPREAMTVFCGPSGSGKTSLAMDTIYAEGQRRYVESLSSYARQFIGQLQKPKVQQIEGLSPSVAIEQKSASNSPRSTVGTVTEVYDYLRVLYSRLGVPYCPDCHIPIGTQTLDEIIAKVLQVSENSRLLIAAPIPLETGQNYSELWQRLRGKGFVRVRIDKKVFNLDEVPELDRKRKHLIEVVVDRIILSDGGVRARLAESLETALELGDGLVHIITVDKSIPETRWETKVHSRHLACEKCGRSFTPLTPHNFSFNSPLGWCPYCEGLGVHHGASPAATLYNPRRSLAEGAVEIFPVPTSPMFGAMLKVFSQQTSIPIDVPFEQLDSRQRRILFHGTGEQWFDCGRFSFQFKGIYPAMEEAGRLSPALRGKLEYRVSEVECHACLGSRLRDDAAAVQLLGRTIDQLCRTPLGTLIELLSEWQLTDSERRIAGDLVNEVVSRIRFMNDVGLDYLTLSRPAPTLSGGEAQRIRLAAQIGSGLVGVLYVLDEPTIGLHPRDNTRLVSALHKLRDLGNTLIVVEHDRDVIAGADMVVDFGPAAGRGGGEIVAIGSPAEISQQPRSVTGPYLSGSKSIAIPSNRRYAGKPTNFITIEAARHNNLKSIDVHFPLAALTVVTGVSGSGKSSLVNDVLYKSLARHFHHANITAGVHDSIYGHDRINKVIRVDQQPLGQTPSSNPATYTGVFDLIRDLFSQLPDAKARGFSARRFSFNVPGGRCERCEGNGQLKIEMHFLPDVWVTCEECEGKRYDRETLLVRYKDRSIADVLEMSCSEALALFHNVAPIRRILQVLVDVGLGYISLGQPAPTLSGGEAQRVKLAAELARPDTGRTLYLLDEPTTGLHFDDLAKLLTVLHRLVDVGNTVVVIEHNLDVIKSADWIVELGPEAGLGGGYIVFEGTPENLVAAAALDVDVVPKMSAKKVAKKTATKKVAKTKTAAANTVDDAKVIVSHTAVALAPVLREGVYETRIVYDPTAANAPQEGDLAPGELGEASLPPWTKDGPRWHLTDRVSRNGHACHWDSRILRSITEELNNHSFFAPTDWNHRHTVRIVSDCEIPVTFFQANTGEEWLLVLKFRVQCGRFTLADLVTQLNLRPLNEIPEIPLYGSAPRVRVHEEVECDNGSIYDEVELRVHSWSEVNTKPFWDFLTQAAESFGATIRLSEHEA